MSSLPNSRSVAAISACHSASLVTSSLRNRAASPSGTVHFARLDAGDGTPGAHVGMERRLLAYVDAIPAVLPALAAVRPAVVVLAHTSVSYALGFDEEPALIERMAKLAGCPAISASRAILAAFA